MLHHLFALINMAVKKHHEVTGRLNVPGQAAFHFICLQQQCHTQSGFRPQCKRLMSVLTVIEDPKMFDTVSINSYQEII